MQESNSYHRVIEQLKRYKKLLISKKELMKNIKKLKDIKINDRDVYILGVSADRIVTNNASVGGYNEGIALFDKDLKEKGGISFALDESIGIYSFFQKADGDEFLFYCPDNKLLIHVNIFKMYCAMIPLNSVCVDRILCPVYWWDNQALLVADYDGNFYGVSLDEKKIFSVESRSIKNSMPMFYNFYQQAVYEAYKIYSGSYCYVAKDSSSVEFVDFLKNRKVTIENILPSAFDFDYRNGVFLLASEHKVVLCSSLDKSTGEVMPDDNYQILRASFLDDSSIVVLSGHNFNAKLSIFSFM